MGLDPPRWLLRLFRAPGWLYRHRLGWVLGRHFLCLVHRGRRSGRRYRTVLEVLAVDAEARRFVVASGFGARADWLRNVEAGGLIEVVVGGEAFAADHRRLALDEAVAVLADYQRRNRLIAPVVRRGLSWLAGWRYDGSPSAAARLAAQLPMVAVWPTGGAVDY